MYKSLLFARSSHVVRNKLYWDANDAVRLSKQRKSYQFSPTFLCFGSPIALFSAHSYHMSVQRVYSHCREVVEFTRSLSAQ